MDLVLTNDAERVTQHSVDAIHFSNLDLITPSFFRVIQAASRKKFPASSPTILRGYLLDTDFSLLLQSDEAKELWKFIKDKIIKGCYQFIP